MSAIRLREKEWHIEAELLMSGNTMGRCFSTVVLAPDIHAALRIFIDVYPAAEPQYDRVKVTKVTHVGAAEILVDFNITERGFFDDASKDGK